METLNKNLLISLLDMAQADLPASVQALARRHGVSRPLVARGLDDLAKRGLVRPATIRLTMMGLVLASSLRAQEHASRRGAAA